MTFRNSSAQLGRGSPSSPRANPVGPGREPVAPATHRARPRPGPGTVRHAEVLLVCALALAVRLVFLDHTPHEDEINHVLAARSLLADGSLSIGDGPPYDRAWVFTYMVAGMFRLFGENLVVGRVPALVFGTLLVVALFLWVRSVCGRAGAWFAAVLLAMAPISIHLSQWIRFYSLHALLVFLAVIAVHRAFSLPRHDRRRAAALLAVAIASFALAFHLQITTAVAAAGAGLWLAIVTVRRKLIGLPDSRRRAVFLAVLVGSAALLFAALVQAGVVGHFWSRLQYVDLWAEANRNNLRFYHSRLLVQYATLWTLFPIAALVAMAFRPRAALLCTCVFTVAFVLHSVAAWKEERYLFYALPFFFAVWGIAASAALPWLRRQISRLMRRGCLARLPTWYRQSAVYGLMGAAILFAAAGNGATSYTHKMLTVDDADWQWFENAPYRGWPDWEAASLELQPLADRSSILLASSEINSLWALGRVDMILRRSRNRSGILAEFAMWRKVPVPVISTRESIARVAACHPSGLVVVESLLWGNDLSGVPKAAAAYLDEHMQRVPVSEQYGIRAYWWQHAVLPDPALLANGCPTP